MRHTTTVSFSLIFTVIACGKPDSSSGLQQFGGQEDTSHYSFTHTVGVGLRSPAGFGHCSGAVIADRWILTNDHCVEESGTTVEVFFGKSFDHASVATGTVHTHGAAQKNPAALDPRKPINDIALIELTSPIPGTHSPAPLLKGSARWPEGSMTSSGYVDVSAAQLNMVSSGFGTKETIKSGTFGYAQLFLALIAPVSQALVVKPEPGKRAGSCSGDSGGPVFVEFPNGNYALGGLTFGRLPSDPCGVSTFAIDLIPQAEWIAKTTGAALTFVDGFEGGEKAGAPLPGPSKGDSNDENPKPNFTKEVASGKVSGEPDHQRDPDLSGKKPEGPETAAVPPPIPDAQAKDKTPKAELCSTFQSRTTCVLEAGDQCKWIGYAYNGSCVSLDTQADVDFTVLAKE